MILQLTYLLENILSWTYITESNGTFRPLISTISILIARKNAHNILKQRIVDELVFSLPNNSPNPKL